jgi:ATP-dependent helicase/nuclease subunit B
VSLTILTGRPSAGTTVAVYDAVRAAVGEGRTALLLLPTLPDVRRARRALAVSCPIGLEVGQLDRLVETLWALHGDGRLPVGRVERRALLARAWRDVALGTPGGEGLLSILGTLARRASEVGRVEVVEPRDEGARALVRAIVSYRRLLDRAGLVEPGEAARTLALTAPAPAGLIVAHHFTDLGPAQEAVLCSWAASAEVIVTLPYDPAVPATTVVGGAVARLTAAGGVTRTVPFGEQQDPELDALESRLFSSGPPLEPGGSVRLAVGQGAEAEARLAASHVALALGEGTPPERIAVAFRDPARHYHWLRRVFDEQDIFADYDVSLPAGETPLGRAVLRLWGFASGGFSRVDLAAFLRSPYAATPAAAVDAADEGWRSSRAKDGPALVDGIGRDAPVRDLVDTMMALSSAPLTAETAKNWKELADRLLANGYPDGVPFDSGQELIDAAVHRALVGAVDALSAIGGSTPSQAIAALRETRVSQSMLERTGHVQVMGVERLRSRRFDVVVLGGMTASEFPRRGAGDTLEGDAVQAAMRALGVTYDQTEEVARERLMFYLSVTRARRRLTLLRQESDEEGRGLRRSVFWDELLDLYRDPGDVADERGPVVEALLVDQLAGSGSSGAWSCAPRGLVTDPGVAAELALIDVVGASDIEAYLACPYAWFVERVLRPGRPDVDIDPRVSGALAHDAVRLFYEALRSSGARRVTPENLPAALEFVGPAVAVALSKAPPAQSLEEDQALGAVERRVRLLVERDAHFLPGYEPIEHEWSFGRGDDGPVDLGAFRLKGRVDRIDSGPEGLMIIDYKGSSATPVAKFADEGKVQLQLYAVAASRRLERPVAGGLYRSLSVAKDRGFIDAGYSGPGIVRTDRIERGAIDDLLARAVEAAAGAVEGMRAGGIAPTPDERRCSYCIASGFCEQALR